MATRIQLTANGEETPYKLIWDFLNKEYYKAFETSPYVTYKHNGQMNTDELNKLCAEGLFNTIKYLIKMSL